jgi:hypothetical protein
MGARPRSLIVLAKYIGETTGQRYIVANERIIAVHGEFCTGCSATRGVCGDLTRALAGERLRGTVLR